MRAFFHNASEIHIKYDADSKCTFIIALNTEDGSRCSGGTRMCVYHSLGHGISDAIELTQGMSKKCKVIGNDFNGGFSGGKGVIIGDPLTQKTPEMLMRYGDFVNARGGRFVTGTDLNINNEDAQCMAKTSPYIDGLNTGKIGDTGIGAAYGILFSIYKMVELYYDSKNLSELRICIQGLGSCGMMLVELLSREGARLIVSDLSSEKVREAQTKYDVKYVAAEEIYDMDCDIFSPNAVGGILNEETIRRLKCRYIIGSANNQLSLGEETRFMNSELGVDGTKVKMKTLDHLMLDKNIVYLPDYVVNIGGVYSSICEQINKDKQYMLDTLKIILDREIDRIHKLSVAEGISLLQAAEACYQ